MKKKKKLRLRTKIILIITSLILAVAAGFGAFLIIGASQGQAEIEESEAQYKTTLIEAPTDGSLPTDHNPMDVIAYSLWTVANTSEFKVTTTGTANALVATQQISNSRIVKDGKAMISTVSSGMVNVAKQRYFSDGKVLLRDPEKIDGVNVLWKDQIPECITYNQNIKRYGWLPFQANGYIICEETYLNKDAIELIDNNDGTYLIKFDLDPADDKAPFWYRREVLTNASSQMVPRFESIHMEFTIDAKYRILKQDIQEKYTVKSMGIEAGTTTDCHDVFEYDNVEFDQDFLNYFLKYGNLTPSEETDEDINTEIDNLTMLVESLMSNTNPLDLVLDINGTKVNGKVSLDISDLTNVSVKALIDQLYVEFKDNNLFIKLGDNLKLKSSIDDIMGLLPESLDTGMAIDTSLIIAAINNAEVTEDGNIIRFSPTLNLAGIELPLEFEIEHIDDSYKLLNAKTNIKISTINLNAEIKESTPFDFEACDYDTFDEIKNIKFITDNVFDIIAKSALTIKGNVSYKDLNLNIDGYLDFKDNINLDLDLNLSYKDLSLPVNVKFINDTVYFTYDDIKLELSTIDLAIMLVKYANIDITKTTSSIDISKIIDIILSIDYSKLIEEAKFDTDLVSIKLGLSEFIANLDSLKLEIKNNEGIDLSVLYQELAGNLNVKAADIKTITKPENYNKVINLSYLIDDVLVITKNKQAHLSLDAKYDELNINLDTYLDFNSDIKLFASLTLEYKTYSFNINLHFVDNSIYLEYDGLMVYITVDDLMSLLGNTSSIDTSNILDIITSIDFAKVIENLVLNVDETVISLNLSDYNDKLQGFIDLSNPVDIKINNTVSGFKVSANILDLNIDVDTTEFNSSVFEFDNSKYYNLKALIENILDLVNAKLYQIDVEGEYKDIKLSLVGYFNREDLSLEANINLQYKENKFDINVYLIDNVIYLSLMDMKVSISIDDIKSLFITDSSDIDIKELLNIILSKDLNKILSKINFNNEEMNIRLDIEEFNLNLPSFLEISNVIDINLIEVEQGLKLSIPELFNLNLGLKKLTNHEITLDTADFYDIKPVIDNIMNLIDNTKYEIKLSGSYKDIKLTGVAKLDRTDSIKAMVNLNLAYKNNSFDIDVYFIDNVIYLSYDEAYLSISIDDIMALIPSADSEFSIDSLLNTLLSLDFNKVLNTLKLNKNEKLIVLDLSDLDIDLMGLIDLQQLININLSEIEDGVKLSIPEIFNLEVELAVSDFEITLDTDKYYDLAGVVNNIKNIIDNTKYEIKLRGSYKDINLSGVAKLDRTEGIKAEVSLNITYKSNSFDINAYFIDNVIYLAFDEMFVKVSLDDIMSLIPNTDSEISIDSLLDTLLSLDLNKVLNTVKLNKNEKLITLDLSDIDVDLKGLIDLQQLININLTEIEDGIKLSIPELFNLEVELNVSDFEITLDDSNYYDVKPVIDNIMNLIDNTKYEIKLSGSYKDINLSGIAKLDRTDSIKAEVTLNITYKTNSFDINVYFIDNAIYLAYDEAYLSISLEDIMALIPDADSEFSVDSLLDTLLSLDLNKVLNTIKLNKNEKLITLDLSDLEIDLKGIIDLQQLININLSEIEDGVKLSIPEIFNLEVELNVSDFEIELSDEDKYYNLSGVVNNIKNIIDNTKYEIKLTGAYKDISLNVVAHLDRTDGIKAEANINLAYKNNSFDIKVFYIDDVIYLTYDEMFVKVSLEDIMTLIPNTDSEFSIDSLLDTLLSLDLNKVLNTVKLNKNEKLITLDLSDVEVDLMGLIDLQQLININLTEIEDGVKLSIPELFNLEAELNVSDFEIELTNGDKYYDVKPLIDNIMTLIDNTKYEIKLRGSYKDINLSGVAKLDRTEGIKAEVALNITYKTNSFDINVYFIDNVIYLSYDEAYLSISIDDIMALIPNADSEFSVDSLLDTLLSLDLNKVLNTIKLNKNEKLITLDLSELDIDLKGLIDLQQLININLSEIEDGVKLSIPEIFNLEVEFEVSDFEITLSDEDKYYDVKPLIDNIMKLIDNTKYEIKLVGSYKDINLSVVAKLDRTDSIKAEVNINLEYKTNSFDIKVFYIDDVIYLSYDEMFVKVSLEDIMTLIPNADSEFTIESLLDTVLSLDLNKVLNTVKLNKNEKLITLDLSDIDVDLKGLIDLQQLININLTEIEDGVKLSIPELFNVEAELNVSDFDIELQDEDKYYDVKPLIDNIMTLIDNTKYEIKITGSYKDINLSGVAKLDRTDSIRAEVSLNITYKTNSFDIKVYYIDDVIYLSYDEAYLSIGLEDIMALIPNADSEFSVDSLLDTLLSLDLNKVLNTIKLNKNEKLITLDLSDLEIDLKGIIDLQQLININLAEIEDGVKLSIPEIFNLEVELAVSDFEIILSDEDKYYNLSNVVNNIKNIIDSTKYEIKLSGSYKDVTLSATGLLDRELLNVNLDINLAYKTYSYEINIKYFNDTKEIFISMNNVKLFLNLESILARFGADSLSVDEILNTLLSLDLNKVLNSVKLNNLDKNITLDLSDLEIDLMGLIDLQQLININLSEIEDGIKLSIPELFNLDVEFNVKDFDEFEKPEGYIDLSNIVDNVFYVLDMYKKESFRVSLDGEVKLSELLGFDMSFDVNGYVDMLLEEDESYTINANMTISNSMLTVDVNLSLINKVLYISTCGLNIKLDLSDFESFLTRIYEIFEIEESPEEFELDSIFGIIDTLEFKNSNELSVDLSTIISKLGVLTVNIATLTEKLNANISLSGISFDVSVDKTDYYDVILKDTYLEDDDIYNLCDIVKVILDLTKEKNFNITLDFTVYDDGFRHLDVEGNVKFVIYENGRFDLELDGTIIEYNDNGSVKMTHMVDAILISKEGFEARGIDKNEDYLYLTYGTNPNNKSSKIKLYTKFDSVLSIVSTISNLLGLDLSFLDGYSTFSFNDIDTSQVTNLFGSVSNQIDLNHIINSFSLTEKRLELLLNLNDIISQPEGSLVTFMLDVNKTDSKIANLYVKNIYTVNDATKRTMLDIDDVTLNNSEASITVPTVNSSWYDISGLDSLVDGLLVTASNKEFAINGTVRMKVLSLLNIDVPVDAKVHVDDEGNPSIYAHLDLSDIGLGRLLVDAHHVYIYYENKYVYIYSKRSSDYYQIKISYEEFLSDIVYYLLDFGMGLSDTILSQIEQSDSSSDSVDAGKVLNNYYSSNNDTKFYFSLDLGELLGNANLGDIEAQLGLREVVVSEDEEGIKKAYALTDIDSFNVNLVSVIDLTLKNGLSLSNVVKSSDGNYRFTSVDLSALRSYVDSYTYDVDMVYKNGKESGRRNHTVTFYTAGYGINNSLVSGPSGSTFTYPEYEYITYEGELYVLEGWYTNKGLTNKSDITTIQDSNIILYAKFVKGYILTLEVGNDTYTYYLAKGADITSKLSKVYTVKVDNKYYITTTYSLNDHIYTESVMPGENITLTANLQEIQYRLYIDNEFYMDFDPETDLGLVSNYSVLYDGIYYNYGANNLTANVLLTRYMSNLVIDGMYGNFYIETYDEGRTEYYTLTLDYSSSFASNWYFGVTIPNDVTPSYEIFDFGSYSSYGINYWYNDLGEYYEENISEIPHTNQTLYAYYYTNKYLGYGIKNNKATISSFDYSGSSITIILPKYVKIGSSYYILATMENISTSDEMESAFTGKTSIKAIYFNDGFETIIGNAFKNCTSLTKVYLSDTITSVATDSFYMKDDETAAKNIRFYLTSNSTLSHSDWLACKFGTLTSYNCHYGKSEKKNLWGTKLDLTSSFASYSNLYGLVHNLF